MLKGNIIARRVVVSCRMGHIGEGVTYNMGRKILWGGGRKEWRREKKGCEPLY